VAEGEGPIETAYAPPAIERRESVEAMLMPLLFDPDKFPGGS
jgi:hypothetical protein